MSLFSSVVNAFSSQQASKAQKRAADAALNTQKEQYAETRNDYAPYRAAGTTALSRLSDAYGDNGQAGYDRTVENFRADPGYKYAVQQGTEAVETSRAARGGLFSGGTLKAIQDRGMNLADQGYSNYLSRIRDMVGVGQNAVGQGAQLGAQSAALQGQYMTDKGNANANSIMAPALAWRQFNQDVASGLGALKGGAFG